MNISPYEIKETKKKKETNKLSEEDEAKLKVKLESLKSKKLEYLEKIIMSTKVTTLIASIIVSITIFVFIQVLISDPSYILYTTLILSGCIFIYAIFISCNFLVMYIYLILINRNEREYYNLTNNDQSQIHQCNFTKLINNSISRNNETLDLFRFIVYCDLLDQKKDSNTSDAVNDLLNTISNIIKEKNNLIIDIKTKKIHELLNPVHTDGKTIIQCVKNIISDMPEQREQKNNSQNLMEIKKMIDSLKESIISIDVEIKNLKKSFKQIYKDDIDLKYQELLKILNSLELSHNITGLNKKIEDLENKMNDFKKTLPSSNSQEKTDYFTRTKNIYDNIKNILDIYQANNIIAGSLVKLESKGALLQTYRISKSDSAVLNGEENILQMIERRLLDAENTIKRELQIEDSQIAKQISEHQKIKNIQSLLNDAEIDDIYLSDIEKSISEMKYKIKIKIAKITLYIAIIIVSFKFNEYIKNWQHILICVMLAIYASLSVYISTEKHQGNNKNFLQKHQVKFKYTTLSIICIMYLYIIFNSLFEESNHQTINAEISQIIKSSIDEYITQIIKSREINAENSDIYEIIEFIKIDAYSKINKIESDFLLKSNETPEKSIATTFLTNQIIELHQYINDLFDKLIPNTTNNLPESINNKENDTAENLSLKTQDSSIISNSQSTSDWDF